MVGICFEPRVFDLAAAELPAVHDRHHQVEHDDAGIGALRRIVQRLAAVGCEFDVVALELQELRQHLARVHVILDNEYRRWLITVLLSAPGRQTYSLGECVGQAGLLSTRSDPAARARVSCSASRRSR